MFVNRVGSLVIGVAAAAVTAAACSMTPQVGVPATVQHAALAVRTDAGPGWMARSLPSHIVYLSDEGGQTVYLFPQRGQNQAPVGKITSGLAAPNGLFVDASENLYVCNFGGGTVTVYHRGKLTPYRTLTGAGSAIDVVVGLDGWVYVSDWDSGSAGRLLEYAPKHDKPSKIVAVNGGPEGLALDKNDDLFLAYNDVTAGDGEVLEFKPKSTTGTNLGIHIGNAGGATIDSKQNLLVVDQNVPGVDVFPPGATKPSKQITGFSLAFDIALTSDDARLWVTTPFTALTDVSYPAGQKVDTIDNTFTSAYGVATSPHGSY